MKRLPSLSSLALLLFGLAIAAPSVRGDDSRPATRSASTIPSEPLDNPASASASLKYLPSDYWLAAEVDCRLLGTLANGAEAQNNPQFAQFKAAMQMLKALTGIDLEKEVDSVAIFAAGNPDKEPNYLCVVQGTFDNQTVEPRLAGMLASTFKEKTYKETSVYVSDDAALSFPVEKTILFGKEPLIHEAIDRIRGKQAALPDAVKKILDRTPGDHVVWAAVRPAAILAAKDLKEWCEQNKELQENLAKLDCVSFSFSATDNGVLTNALGIASNSESAKETFDYLSDRKRSLLTREGSNVFSASFLMLSHLQRSGAYVQGSFQITKESFDRLWNTKVIVKPKASGLHSPNEEQK